ncbi:unnamed protein product [Periconia digitata]|uniref:Uncharacterized protein n=1 Tax=Periconia digitata TaxID=1303443 RepID=A0A9W4UBE7_9PLEO|nr:unnamed protein product [Periconia digitata]
MTQRDLGGSSVGTSHDINDDVHLGTKTSLPVTLSVLLFVTLFSVPLAGRRNIPHRFNAMKFWPSAVLSDITSPAMDSSSVIDFCTSSKLLLQGRPSTILRIITTTTTTNHILPLASLLPPPVALQTQVYARRGVRLTQHRTAFRPTTTATMPSSPAGSTAFFTLALLSISAAVLLLLRYYLPLRTTPAYVTVPVFLTVVLPASIILLVPIDLASSAGTDTDGNRGIWLSERVVYKSWRVTYWLTFFLTWAVLPLLGEYVDSGYREPMARFLYSLRSNARYWIVMLASGTVYLIYFVWNNGFHWDVLKSTAMALAYAWALVLAIYLMGHGLVAFPRSLYRYASISGRLKRLQAHAPKIHDKLTESMDKLDQCEYQVMQLKQRKNGMTRPFQEWVDELAEKSSLPENRAGMVGNTTAAATAVPTVITERYLADLTRRLKRARHAKLRFEAEWDRLVHKALKAQAILDSKASQRLEFRNSQFQTQRGPSFIHRLTMLTPYTRYHLHVHIIPTLCYTAWVLTSLASLSVVWSECIGKLEPKLSLIGLTVVHHPGSHRNQIGFGGQVTAAVWLCYMCTCAFFSLTEVKIWGNRALVRRNTYQESATWYALQCAKLTVPLAYNFSTFMPPVLLRATSFYKLLGQYVNFTPVMGGFSAFFPTLILVPVLATAFGLYKKAKNISGFGDLLEDESDEAEDAAGTGGWREGRALIEREVQSASGNVLGLAQRGGSSASSSLLATDRYSDGALGAGGAESSGAAGRARRFERRRPAVDDDDEDSGNFFENFGVRVKNTFETADFSFSRPRWLGGDDDDDDDGNGTGRRGGGGGARRDRPGLRRGSGGAGGDGGGSNGSFLGLFGGRPDEGRVRL